MTGPAGENMGELDQGFSYATLAAHYMLNWYLSECGVTPSYN